MAEDIEGNVRFTAFNPGMQLALDDKGNTWRVDGWFINEGSSEDDELAMEPDNWCLVDYVTVWQVIDGRKVWAVLFPADFTGEAIRTDN